MVETPLTNSSSPKQKSEKIPTYAKLTSEEDLEFFLEGFELHMQNHGVKKERWRQEQLPTLPPDA